MSHVVSNANPMLLTVFTKSTFVKAQNPWFVSEKYDGWRMVYDHDRRAF
jgi:hypothetical protein